MTEDFIRAKEAEAANKNLRKLNTLLEDRLATLESQGRRRIIKFQRYFGRVGVMFSIENVDGKYGQPSSKGCSYHLSLWKDPK